MRLESIQRIIFFLKIHLTSAKLLHFSRKRGEVALAMGSEPPMRFLFVLVGPRHGPTNLMEVGESLAALTVDEELNNISMTLNRLQKYMYYIAYTSYLNNIIYSISSISSLRMTYIACYDLRILL